MRTRTFTEETKTAAIREKSVDAFGIIDLRGKEVRGQLYNATQNLEDIGQMG